MKSLWAKLMRAVYLFGGFQGALSTLLSAVKDRGVLKTAQIVGSALFKEAERHQSIERISSSKSEMIRRNLSDTAREVRIQNFLRSGPWFSFSYIHTQKSSSDLFERVKSSIEKRHYSTIIFLENFTLGGSSTFVRNFLREAQLFLDDWKFLVVDTGTHAKQPGSLGGSNYSVVSLQDFDVNLSQAEIQRVLFALVGTVGPSSILLGNSMVAWDLVKRRSFTISEQVKIVPLLFCENFSGRVETGFHKSHLKYFTSAVRLVLSDNNRFYSKVEGLLEKDTKWVRLVLKPSGESINTPSQNGPIVWAGRFAEQKNPYVLDKIAKLLPDRKFIIFIAGATSSDIQRMGRRLSSKNIFLMPPYGNFEQMVKRYNPSLFLNTSLWDGLPNVVVEAVHNNLPVVSSDVGGISELITDELGWLIANPNDPASYSAAIRHIQQNWELSLEKARLAKVKLDTLHSSAAEWDIIRNLI